MTTSWNQWEFVAQASSTEPHHIDQVGRLLGDLGLSVSSLDHSGQFVGQGDFSDSSITEALVDAMENPSHALQYVAPASQLRHLEEILADGASRSPRPSNGFCKRITPDGIARAL